MRAIRSLTAHQLRASYHLAVASLILLMLIALALLLSTLAGHAEDVGALVTPPVNGLYVQGPIEPVGGIKSATQPILIESTTDSIEIKAGGNRVVVYANGGIKILGSGASGNNIVIDAGGQNLTLKGANVTIESTAQTTLSSGTATTLSAGASLNLNGALIKLNNGNIPLAKIGSTVVVNPGTGVGTVTGNGTATILGQ